MNDVISFVGIGLIVGLAAGGALAQAIQQKQTPLEQALGNKLMQEINENVGLRSQIIQLEEQLKVKAVDPPAAAKDDKK